MDIKTILEDFNCYRKRYFMGLTCASAALVALTITILWLIMEPGLRQLHSSLPMLVGIVFGLAVAVLLLGASSILVALLGVRLPVPLYVLAWKVINFLFPLALFLGRQVKIPKYKVQQSFVAVNNVLVSHYKLKVPAERLLILTPHCIQWDKCVHKITRNVENCHQCGRCGVGDMLELAHKYGCKFVVATGGTLARQMIKEARPKAVVAVACERDLTSGMQDVFPLPVLGVPNERPNGPCFNTKVDINKLEQAILAFLEEDAYAEKK